MKNLCIFSTNAYSVIKQNGAGGSEMNLFFISRELKKYNINSFFITGDFNQKNVEIINDVTFFKIRFLNPSLKKMYFKILRFFYIIKTLFCIKTHIFLISGYSNYFFIIYIIGKFFRKKKIIFRSAHRWDLNEHFKEKNFIQYFFYSIALKKADKIIVQNLEDKKLLKKNLNLSSTVIKNGWKIENPEFFKKDYFLWVGRCETFKRPELLIDIASKMPDHKFIMIIPGKKILREKLISKALNLNNILFYDYVKSSEVDIFFKNAKCFINTSESEGFPNTFIQSFQYMTPVLSLKVNPDNIISRYNLGFISNDNIEDSTNFLDSLDYNKIKSLGKNCYNYVKTEHNIIDKGKEYKKIIEDLF